MSSLKELRYTLLTWFYCNHLWYLHLRNVSALLPHAIESCHCKETSRSEVRSDGMQNSTCFYIEHMLLMSLLQELSTVYLLTQYSLDCYHTQR